MFGRHDDSEDLSMMGKAVTRKAFKRDVDALFDLLDDEPQQRAPDENNDIDLSSIQVNEFTTVERPGKNRNNNESLDDLPSMNDSFDQLPETQENSNAGKQKGKIPYPEPPEYIPEFENDF